MTAGVLVALGTVYLVWGSTYLAIKYIVGSLPPFLAMGARFLLAGALLTVDDPGVPRAAGLPDDAHPVRHRRAVRAVPAGRRQRPGRRRRAGRRLQHGRAAHRRDAAVGGPAARGAARPAVGGHRRRASWSGWPAWRSSCCPGVQGTAALGPLLLVCLSSVLWSVGTVLATRRPMPADPFVTTVVQMAVGGTAMVVLGSLGGEWGRLDAGGAAPSAWIAFAYLVRGRQRGRLQRLRVAARPRAAVAGHHVRVREPGGRRRAGRAVPRRAAHGERARRRRR